MVGPLGPDWGAATWLPVLRRYVMMATALHLFWEFAQLPLYTISSRGTIGEIAFAVFHCTAGDFIIATVTLVLALVAAGGGDWPAGGYVRVALLAGALGVGYTMFSEWLNVVVRQSWEYSALMPVVPWVGTGLSPLAQWVGVPAAAFAWAKKPREGMPPAAGERPGS
ncbi:MAG: hypothetical protein ACT4P2_08815 [Pseudomonadota bacterium]